MAVTNKERFIKQFVDRGYENTYPIHLDFTEDLIRILSGVPEISDLSNPMVVDWLYNCFSHHEYCANWIGVNNDSINDFSEWLKADHVSYYAEECENENQ